jgi:hypothetical protein
MYTFHFMEVVFEGMVSRRLIVEDVLACMGEIRFM